MSIIFALFLAAAAAPSQDMVGVSWGGSAYYIDSATGTGGLLGNTGYGSINSMAKAPNGTIYAMAGYGSSNSLITINPATGAATLVGNSNLISVRGLAFGAAGTLYAAEDTSGTGIGVDDIYTVNTTNGFATRIGSTGYSGIQGLGFANGTLYGWEAGSGSGFGIGLVTINTSTGAATDVNPAVGGTASEVQTICASPSGQIYGGRDALYTINAATGVITLVGSGGYGDLRGIEFTGAGGPVLSKTGTCPGSMTVAVDGCTPNRPVAFFHGPAGTYTKPGGVCAGTTLSINNPTLAAVINANGAGKASITFNATPGYCGRTVQAVNVANCKTTNTITL
jgi:hypothetical protein